MKIMFSGTTGAVSTKENTNVSFSLIEGDASMLIDASGDPLQSLMRAGIHPPDLDVLILTHAHPDHLYALPSLIHNLWLLQRKKTLYILTNPYTETKAKELCDVFALLVKERLFAIEWIALEEGPVDLLPGISITLFPVDHSVPNSGVKIRTASSALVYSSDTRPSEKLIQAAEGCKALIHEATGSQDDETHLNADGHSSARQAGEIAEKTGVETLYVCHFDSRQAKSPAELQQEAQRVFRGKVVIPQLFTSYEV